MSQDVESIRAAWQGLSDLTASMACGCSIEEDDVYTLYLVAGKCKEFLEAYEWYQQPTK